MKRIFALFALIGIMVAGASAQGRSMATLSHNGELTFFDKLSCFEDALEAAEAGDIIYLSSGTFGSEISKIINIRKPIRIIGNGYDSHILPTLQLNKASGDTAKWTYTSSAPFCDGVRLETLSFYRYQGNFDQIELTSSWINTLINGEIDNLMVDRCRIMKYNGTSSGVKNVELRNSKIKVFNGRQKELLVNCNIDSITDHWPGYVKSSIVRGMNSSNSLGDVSRFENCLGGKFSNHSKCELVNCYSMAGTGREVLDENMETTVDLKQNGFLGTDGTVVGIYGGEWLPYSESPTVPAVKASASSVKYDPAKNQLDVNITVAE